MTENMRDGSDAISDWPLLDAMMLCASKADLVAIHSGGGGYSGYMTSAGVTLVADGSEASASRLSLSLTNDTSLGIMRYADAGYPDAIHEAQQGQIRYLAGPKVYWQQGDKIRMPIAPWDLPRSMTLRTWLKRKPRNRQQSA